MGGASRASLSFIIVFVFVIFVFCHLQHDSVSGDMWEEQIVPLPLLLWTTKNAASHSLYQQQCCTISDSISYSANSTVTIALLLFIADYSNSSVTYIRLQEQYCSAKNTYFISQWQTRANFTLECLLTVVTLYCTDSMHLTE